MRAPLSWLKEFASIPASLSAEAISDAFIRVGFEVEEIIHQGADLSGPLVTGQVLSIEEITEFKKPIRYVGLDCGEDVTRYVICGATNFAVGDLVVVALPGAVLPGGFAIAARETYGKISDGMIASSRELGLSEDHTGIMVLPPQSASIGADPTTVLEISDVIFEIAVNPDRGYALSIRGLAREIAGALGVAFKDPVDALRTLKFEDSGVGVKPKVETGASIFYCRTLGNYNPKSTTPLWMRRRIEKMGMRSISLAVDITNYVMLELGQPLHAFDADKISGDLRIGCIKKSQQFETLDGQMREVTSEDLLVMDDKAPLAIAGTMGALKSEISETTTRLAVEAVRFDSIAIAKNSRHHKLSTEASRRFERSVDPELAELASARCANLLIELGGALHIATLSAGSAVLPQAVHLEPTHASKVLGVEVSTETVSEILHLIGCVVDSKFSVTPPSWRWDLTQPADFVEEIARLIGYDKIPSVLPPKPLHASLSPSQKRQRAMSASLAAQGLSEVQTFPFTNDALILSMGYVGDRASTYRLANPMSEDLPVLRTHLLPGLAQVAARNIGRGAKDIAIFEIGAIFRKSKELIPAISPKLDHKPGSKIIADIFESVPSQPIHLAAILAGKVETESWRGKARSFDLHDAIAHVERLLEMANLTWSLERSDFAPWHPGRCVEFLIDGKAVAHAGELHPRVVAQFSLPPRSVAFVVNLDALPATPLVRAKSVASMPAAFQDVALVVDDTVSARDVESALREGAGELLESITLFDRYEKVGDGKVSLAFTLVFRSLERTLTGEEVSGMREAATLSAFTKCGAIVRTA